MNPETKIILDEMSKRFNDLESKWGSRFSEAEEKFEARFVESEAKFESRLVESERKIEARIVDSEAKIESRIVKSEDKIESRFGLSEDSWERRYADLEISHDARVSALERVSAKHEDIEGTISDIRLQMGKLNKHWERTLLDRNAPLFPSTPPAGDHTSPHPSPSSAAGRISATGEADRPHGHHVANCNRADGFGSVTTVIHPPVKGMSSDSFPSLCHTVPNLQPVFPDRFKAGASEKLPKLNFPWFDGDSPKLWISRCEDYFELMNVASVRWVKVACLHLSDAAARWLQSVETKAKSSSWSEFCKMVLDRFGRDQHELLIRQMLHLRQTGLVKEYIEQFAALADQLAAYEPNADPLHSTMKFIDGLKDELRSAVLMQRPPDLDTAYVLAQLQEEVGDSSRKSDYKKVDYSYSNKPQLKAAYPIPSPPSRSAKQSPSVEVKKSSEQVKINSAEDRWRALKSLRRSKGLCQYCAEKWSRDHKCADSVQLHVMQELLQVFHIEDDSVSLYSGSQREDQQLFLTLSIAAVSGLPSPKTLCLDGVIQGHQMRILVDSGSSHSFISTALATNLSGASAVDSPMGVQVANGDKLVCSHQFVQAQWSVAAYSFVSDLKILALSSYDMVLGMDWLESHSPMKVHWQQKWLAVPYKGSTAVLYGSSPSPPEGTVIQVCSVQAAIQDDKVVVLMPPEIEALIQEFAELFEIPSELPPPRACDHAIPLIEGAAPIQVRPYRYAPALKDEIERQIKEMLDKGIIQKSSSSFSSSVLLVKKKDGTWRFCVDYRHLNAITIKGKYPVPVIDEFLDELANASWFTCLDLRAGFHQIRLKPGEEFKTAFQTHCGQYEFRVMAFGLTGAPGSFQEAMNSTLAPYLRKFVLVFFDDILIYSTSYEDHIQHIRLVFQLLAQEQWKIKLSKCVFAQREISYLGYVISEKGVGTDPTKVSAIAQWPTPTSAKELRSFLGLAGYYRKFVKGFGLISRPLTDLLKKHSLFIWTSVHDKSFAALKHTLCHAPVLALPDFSKTFAIETDASGTGVGAVLLQDGHPLAYISKALGPKSQGLSTYEKEYLAILLAVQQWRAYLQHNEFIIFTDQKSLTQLTEQRLHTHWQQKVFSKMLGLQYRVVYKQGIDNRVADALSRKSTHELSCASLSAVSPQWMQEVADGYSLDEFSQTLLTKLTIDKDAVPHFSLVNGLIRYKGRLWIGANPQLQRKLLSASHESAIGGHSGVPATYMRMKKLFAWKGMKADITHFVKHCMVCQQAKPDRSKSPGLLQPLEIPSEAWQIISMDFVEGLPQSSSANCVLVVVDYLTKYAHFLPLRHPFTAPVVARVFMDNVYKLHGLPQAIVTDRDRIFTSNWWKELFRLAGVTLRMSSSYHPQSDGQTERLNQTMETYLRCFVNACPSKWVQWLSLAEYWYNTSSHSAIGRSPFEALYGYSPKHFGITDETCVVPEVSVWVQDRQLMNTLLKQHLTRSRLRMKRQEDKNRSERSFQVGDMVLLKIQPYVQSSLANRSSQKLSFKFFGPYKIIEKVGSVAYKLLLPPSSSIHPVFHVSQLKAAPPSDNQVLPIVPSDIDLPRIPEMVLHRRMITRGLKPVKQILVKWSNWPLEMATWEDAVALQQQFPFAPAWGQAASQPGGNASSHQEESAEANGPQAISRPRKRNPRVTGEEWVV
ncbi:unnamed protein product [Urochloa humidicola]